MFCGGLVDVFSINKINFHLMKNSGQNIAPSMIDAFVDVAVVVTHLLFVAIWIITGPNLHL